jgi:hypothetical protein
MAQRRVAKSSDTLDIRYVPLEQVRRWDRNPKPHDIGGLIESFNRYGFKDPMKFEPTLNDGEGGVVEGNGRTEALMVMRDDGSEPPRGVALAKDGGWAVPVLFGVDAKSIQEAEAYALDHNNLTVLGGYFGPEWMHRLYDLEGLTELLADLGTQNALPVSIEGEDVDALLKLRRDYLPDDGFFDASKLPDGPLAGHTKSTYIIFIALPDEDGFRSMLNYLSPGERGETIPDGSTKAVIEGAELLERIESEGVGRED